MICNGCKRDRPLRYFQNYSLRIGEKICKFCKKNYNKNYRRTVKGVISRMWQSQNHCDVIKRYGKPKYLRQEFVRWIEENFETFIYLYKIWESSGYKKELKPSIDRVDPTNGYSLDNIQLMTWKENDDKGKKERGEKRRLK